MTRFRWHYIVAVMVTWFNMDISSSSYVAGASEEHTKALSKSHLPSSKRKNTNDFPSVDDNIEKRPFAGMFGGSYKIGKRPFVVGSRYNFKKRSLPLYNSEMENNMDFEDPQVVYSADKKAEMDPFSTNSNFHLKKRPFVLGGLGWRPVKRQYDPSLNDFIPDEAFDDDFTGIDKKFVMRTGYPWMHMSDRLGNSQSFDLGSSFNKRSNSINGEQGFSKRPFVFSYGKRGVIVDESISPEIRKRPFVLNGGWKIGKRPFVMGSTFGKRNENKDMQKRPFVIGSGYQLGKRPFVLGNWGMYGKRNTMKSNEELSMHIKKRPFVLGGGWRIGKRPFVFRSFGKRDPEEFDTYGDEDIDKRPFVLAGGYKFGKRPFMMGRVFDKRRTTGPDMVELNKRPFVLGSGWQLGKRSHDLDDTYHYFESPSNELTPNNNPYNTGSYRVGEELETAETLTDPFTDNENKVNKRPFVFGSGRYFGKRGSVFNKAQKRNVGDILDDPAYDVDLSLVKRPVFGSLYGGGFKFGKR